MPRRRDTRPAPALEIKTARIDGLRVVLNTAERDALDAHLDTLFADVPEFFSGETAWFDATRLGDTGPDWPWLAERLRARGLRPIGVDGAAAAQRDAIRDAGLIALPARAAHAPLPTAPAPATAEPAEITPTNDAPANAPATRIVDKPLRSGQRIYAAGDIVILAAVNPGAEVIADGSIHVYAPLMGRALAGARGATGARIFVQKLQAELVSIAGIYRTFEHGAAEDYNGEAVQVRLDEDGTLKILPL
ncbi:MAG: septum site-determining protein MinC [Thiobacillus sp.]|nr:septum site-determining protein MinC [Thiobacillus sp.]